MISRFYVDILGRSPDPDGLAAWVAHVVATGDLEGAAMGFLGSEELENRPLTFRDYVTVLYRAFLGRTPDPAGLDGWEGVLRDHLVQVITRGFIPSGEFQERLATVCGP